MAALALPFVAGVAARYCYERYWRGAEGTCGGAHAGGGTNDGAGGHSASDDVAASRQTNGGAPVEAPAEAALAGNMLVLEIATDLVALRDGKLGDSTILGFESKRALDRVLKALGSAVNKADAKAAAAAAASEHSKETVAWLQQQYAVHAKETTRMRTQSRRTSFLTAMDRANGADKDRELAAFDAAADEKRSWLVAPETSAALEGFNHHDWDIFKLEGVVGRGRCLTVVACAAFDQLGMHDQVHEFTLGRELVARWASGIEARYNPEVPYHNSTHAADVLQTTIVYLREAGFLNWMATHEVLAMLMAVVGHDVGHPGRNNGFHVRNGTPVALRYNDKAVLENMHCALMFEMMRDDESIDVLRGLAEEDRRKIRGLVISLVCVTDMAEHFPFVANFKEKTLAGFDLGNTNDRLMLMQMCLKAADISNQTRVRTARRWAKMMLEEFHSQGDEERSMGVPVSPLCDRATANVPESQVNFIKIVLLPLYDAWANQNPAVAPFRDKIAEVRASWQKEADEAKALKA